MDIQLSISFKRGWTQEEALKQMQYLFEEIMRPDYVVSATLNGEKINLHTLRDDVLKHSNSQLVEWQALSPPQQRFMLKVRQDNPRVYSLKGGEYATFKALKRRGYVRTSREEDADGYNWWYRIVLTDSGLALMEQLERETATQ